MLWLIVLILFTILMFLPQTEGMTNPSPSFGTYSDELNEIPQTSVKVRTQTRLEDYYKAPMINCPENYEQTMKNLFLIDGNMKLYGYTGNNRYIDDRYIKWERLNTPLPTIADFFMR